MIFILDKNIFALANPDWIWLSPKRWDFDQPKGWYSFSCTEYCKADQGMLIANS